MSTRQLTLDTETTGLTDDKHRIIEIACVEIVERSITGKEFHQYLNPERDIDPGAAQVHGLTLERLRDEPIFADIVAAFLAFIQDSELIIHNAPFDEGFLNAELARLKRGRISDYCRITDTVVIAREKHPGRQNNLDALCQRYRVDNSHRTLHGALTDAQLLARVYLAMTGGQANMAFTSADPASGNADSVQAEQDFNASDLVVLHASEEEQTRHRQLLEKIAQGNKTGSCIWLQESQGG